MRILRMIGSILLSILCCPESYCDGAVEVCVGLTKVTAYCPCEKCCGRFADGITANGHKIKPGDRFVAAPKKVPFWTMLVVPGYNDGEPVPVLDRGGAIKEGCIDVFFHTHEEALEWGVKWLRVRQVKK